jgi:hypothetical protein
LDGCKTRRSGHAIVTVVEWAKTRADIRGVALVGSRATGKARPDSDIDLILLAANPDKFRADPSWIGAIDWADAAVGDPTWSDEDYGVMWSRRISLGSSVEVEMSFAYPSWASIAPLDPGTRQVITDGCQILYDPDGWLQRAQSAVTDPTDCQT